ncbi:MAG: GNAT family N-acetyltransferase [Roseiflexaceae bacterium]
MTDAPRILIIAQKDLNPTQRAEIVELCSRAYSEDFSSVVQLPDDQPIHSLAYLNGNLVSHALWFTRLLDYNGIPLQSAYVEAVATEPAYQGRGYASILLRHLARAITAYDIGALSPSDPAFYARLGWELWRGSLFVAAEAEIAPTPEYRVMILRVATCVWASCSPTPDAADPPESGDLTVQTCSNVVPIEPCNPARG